MDRQLPWSCYTLPSGCKVFLTSRPDRFVRAGQTFTELFGEATGSKATIRLSFTDDYIKGALGERHVWIPWFVDADKHEGSNPTLAAIATAVTQIRHYESPNAAIWLHCDSSSMRAPTFFGLFLNAYYYDQINAVLGTIVTNMPENYHWSSPKEYAQIDLDRDPKVMVVLSQIKEKL